MKQQVNFFTDEFKPKKEYLTLENILIVWFAAIVFILALYNLEVEKLTVAKSHNESAQKREQHQQKLLRELQSNFADRGEAVVLEKILEDLQSNLEQRKFVLAQLGLKADGMAKGVASLMRDLATKPIKDLWLTEISVHQGQLSLSGLTKDVEKIPQLIQRLQNLNSLNDKRFARLNVQLVEDNKSMKAFTLQSANQIVEQKPLRGRRR